MSKSPESAENIEYHAEDNSVTLTSGKKYGKEKKTMGGLTLVTSHIPGPYEILTFYYGVFSLACRGEHKAEGKEVRVYPVNTKAGTDSQGKLASAWTRLT